MIQCPDCRQMIPDDSAFCDQCGKELKWCPECRRPKRGTECPVCGSDLIPGRKYLKPCGAYLTHTEYQCQQHCQKSLCFLHFQHPSLVIAVFHGI